MNTYQVIDEKNWERATHCMVFRESVEPAFCVTFEADITNFRRKVKARNLSFTLAFVYAVCKCANGIEAFRYPSRLIILLWMGYILGSLRICSRDIWNRFRSGSWIISQNPGQDFVVKIL